MSKINDSNAIFDVLDSYGVDKALSALCHFENVETIEGLAKKVSVPADKIAAIREDWQFLELLNDHFPHILQNQIFKIEKDCGF